LDHPAMVLEPKRALHQTQLYTRFSLTPDSAPS
jgi:hypothetical protein